MGTLGSIDWYRILVGVAFGYSCVMAAACIVVLA